MHAITSISQTGDETGIWDCLTSQKAVDIVRYLVSLDKPLSEIPGIIFDHCLRPASDDGKSSGQDNMTMVVVAFLHGRTQEEWYAWIKGGVKNGYVMPELYSEGMREKFRIMKEREEARVREKKKHEVCTYFSVFVVV
jgi:protein phosphatase 2C family protein 2/3